MRFTTTSHRAAIAASLALGLVSCQTISLSSCSRNGNAEYCLGPDGATHLWTTYAEATPTGAAAPTATALSSAASLLSVTAVSDCHIHESAQYCMAGTVEYRVVASPTATGELPAEYTGCHPHDDDLYCIAPDGNEVELVSGNTTTHEADDHDDPSHSQEPTEQSCHYHAGVEHCVGDDESEDSHAVSCGRQDRDYNIPLRVGLTFVMLATGAICVFTPILVASFVRFQKSNLLLMLLKQFGTGVVVSTAFVHLLTHATLMFSNECLGELNYEATSAAIFMAGIFLSLLVEYTGTRFVSWRRTKTFDTHAADEEHAESAGIKRGTEGDVSGDTTLEGTVTDLKRSGPPKKLSVLVMEAGIVFHSLLIGLTLVVAGDSFFLTLFAVIVFHQGFEGIALGTRIAELPSASSSADTGSHSRPVSLLFKLCMGLAFALITPIGMAIGIGVLDRFNGSDPATLIAIGTLDALSAGILAWVGLVEMWAHDWLHGELAHASLGKTVAGGCSLVAGLALMSLLGKWA